MAAKHQCRICSQSLEHPCLDLGFMPAANQLLAESELSQSENLYPVKLFFCENCELVQLFTERTPQEKFNHYLYRSSASSTWLQHLKSFVGQSIERLKLCQNSLAIEIGCNDGALLNFFQKQSVKVLGIEPSQNLAKSCSDQGIQMINQFFTQKLAKELFSQNIQADLIVVNNVLAHVPNLHDFVAGLKLILKSEGVLSIEFPHLLNLIHEAQFDTIYDEHLCYFSLAVVVRLFGEYGLRVLEAEKISTHGGSLRVLVKHQNSTVSEVSGSVKAIIEEEKKAEIFSPIAFQVLQDRIKANKDNLLKFLQIQKNLNKTIVAYGASAKATVLLNYFQISTDLISFIVDKNQSKQNRYIPGVRIPIFGLEKIEEYRPDFLLILVWNLKTEILKQMDFIRSWQAKFVLPIPRLEVIG